MPPDSDTYSHIFLNGLLWYAVLFGIPTVRWAIRTINRRVQQRIDRAVDGALPRPNLRVIR